MTSGKASVFSPAHAPVFDPSATRTPTRVRRQSAGVCEMPPFSFPGVIFSPPSALLRSVIYSPVDAETVREVVRTVVQPPSSGGVRIQIMRGHVPFEVVLWTSELMFGTYQAELVSIPVVAYDVIWVRVSEDASEDSIGLNIMLRYCPGPPFEGPGG